MFTCCNQSIYIALPTKRPEAYYRLIYTYSANPWLNNTVLRQRLKDIVVDRWSLTSVETIPHMLGCKAECSVSKPYMCLWHRSPLSAVRSEARNGTSPIGLLYNVHPSYFAIDSLDFTVRSVTLQPMRP